MEQIDTLNDVENTELMSNKVMFADTDTGLLSNMTETLNKDHNRDLMDTGILMEQSLKINLDPRRSIAERQS